VTSGHTQIAANNLAAMLVEPVSGTTLEALCWKEFFQSLGMTASIGVTISAKWCAIAAVRRQNLS
jgi:CubicO group peptidase (beta-lactamase class C family)